MDKYWQNTTVQAKLPGYFGDIMTPKTLAIWLWNLLFTGPQWHDTPFEEKGEE